MLVRINVVLFVTLACITGGRGDIIPDLFGQLGITIEPSELETTEEPDCDSDDESQVTGNPILCVDSDDDDDDDDDDDEEPTSLPLENSMTSFLNDPTAFDIPLYGAILDDAGNPLSDPSTFDQFLFGSILHDSAKSVNDPTVFDPSLYGSVLGDAGNPLSGPMDRNPTLNDPMAFDQSLFGSILDDAGNPLGGQVGLGLHVPLFGSILDDAGNPLSGQIGLELPLFGAILDDAGNPLTNPTGTGYNPNLFKETRNPMPLDPSTKGHQEGSIGGHAPFDLALSETVDPNLPAKVITLGGGNTKENFPMPSGSHLMDTTKGNHKPAIKTLDTGDDVPLVVLKDDPLTKLFPEADLPPMSVDPNSLLNIVKRDKPLV